MMLKIGKITTVVKIWSGMSNVKFTIYHIDILSKIESDKHFISK